MQTNVCTGGVHGESNLIENNYINRPYLDEKIVRNIFGLKKFLVVKRLKKVLNKRQINCIWWKIKILKKSINNTLRVNENFLLKQERWSDETIKEELSGKYGKTYLSSLCE